MKFEMFFFVNFKGKLHCVTNWNLSIIKHRKKVNARKIHEEINWLPFNKSNNFYFVFTQKTFLFFHFLSIPREANLSLRNIHGTAGL